MESQVNMRTLDQRKSVAVALKFLKVLRSINISSSTEPIDAYYKDIISPVEMFTKNMQIAKEARKMKTNPIPDLI